MFDLKLNTMEEESVENLDPIQVFSDFLIAQEELTNAENELNELNRCYTNLSALQEVVNKHGWNEVLNDLVGDQISAESLDASCEGLGDKIKEASKNVGNALIKFITSKLKVIDLFIKRLTLAKQWLKAHQNELDKNKNVSNSSESESIDITNISKGQYFDIKDLMELHKYNTVDDLLKHCKKVSYKDMSTTELYNACSTAITALKVFKPMISDLSNEKINIKENIKHHDKLYHEYVNNSLKKPEPFNPYDRDPEAIWWTKDPLVSAKEEKEKIDNLRRQRRRNYITRRWTHFIVMSCHGLLNEVNNRGFKQEKSN